MSEEYVQLSMKEFNPSVVDSSVVEQPDPRTGGIHRMILAIANYADDIPTWSKVPHSRDQKLREFIPKENLLTSTIYAAVARIANFRWDVVPADMTKAPPKNTMKAVKRSLTQWSDRGEGWLSLVQKTFIDFYTQDNGAFWELIRRDDRPDSPVIAIGHLDANRCTRTGNARVPVIYEDIYGKTHYLNWWNVHTFEDMPSAEEDAYGVGYCALTRALLAAQILRDIDIYKREKVSGNFTRAIHFVSGVSQGEIDDGMLWAREQMLNNGLYRYSQPVIIPGLDPSHPVSVETVNLASLPDAFDEDTTLKWYVAQLAAAFGLDYQEIAPLPGGNLGSSQQSDILHQKTQGKGPALAISKIEDALNNHGYLPNTIRFEIKEHDIYSEKAKADAAFTRTKRCAMQITSGILDPEGALDLAVLDGDVPEWIADQVKARGLAQEWYENRLQQGAPQMSSNQVEGGVDSQEMR